MFPMLLDATYDTLKLVFVTTILTIILGVPLGLLLEATYNPHVLGHKYLWLHKLLYSITTFFNNAPSFLLLVMFIPIVNNIFFEHFTIEFSATISMTVISIFIFANDFFKDLNTLPKELSITAKILGAEPLQIITKFLLPESIKHLINNITKLMINLVGMSVIVSALGVNGLGKLALEKSYYELELSYTIYTILLSIIMIYIIKFLGNYLVDIIYSNKQQSHI